MSIVVRKLIFKELYVYRWMALIGAVSAIAAAVACSFGEIAFNVGSLTWITVVIAWGVMLAIYGVMQERKEQTLQFVMSLPLSVREYVFAKLAGLLLTYLIPWLAAAGSAVVLVLAAPQIPDGLLPYVVLLSFFMLANFSVVLCGALHARSEALVSAAIIVTNMAVSLFMFIVGALPGIKNHLEGPVPVWNQTFFNVLLVELIVLVIAVTLPLATVARRRDFI